MKISQYNSRRFTSKGFTLIEVMLVVVLIGIMASLVQFTSGSRQGDTIKHASERFRGVFHLASEYSLLNNVQLGLIVEENSYQFVGYDGVGWSEIPSQDVLAQYTLPEEIEITLQLDDLPIEEPLLFDTSVFVQDDEDFFEGEIDPEEKKLMPQVYILSGGDITPFSLIFGFIEEIPQEKEITYRISGIYSTPLTLEGPFFDGDRPNNE